MLEAVQWLRVDPDARTPLFDQLRLAVIDAVRDGRLPPGTRLPTVRELAGELGLAVNTVARAYRELESAGVVETRRRFGTVVAARNPTEATMSTAAHSYAEAARALGLSKAEALAYLDVEFG
ncbi:MAG: GntR family transcriptional regulator [Mycobacterium sp.]